MTTTTHVDYREYLNSKHWLQVRIRFCRPGTKCSACRSKFGIQLHHLTYKTLNHESIVDVLPLCDPCHRRLHFELDSRFPLKTLEYKVSRTAAMFPLIFGIPMPYRGEGSQPKKKRGKKRGGRFVPAMQKIRAEQAAYRTKVQKRKDDERRKSEKCPTMTKT